MTARTFNNESSFHREPSGFLFNNGVSARPTGSGPIAWLGQILADIWQRFVASQREAAVIAELSRLSERDLADIGLNRGDLSHIFEPSFIARREADRAALRGFGG